MTTTLPPPTKAAGEKNAPKVIHVGLFDQRPLHHRRYCRIAKNNNNNKMTMRSRPKSMTRINERDSTNDTTTNTTSTTPSAASSSSTDGVISDNDDGTMISPSKKKRAFAKWYSRGGGGNDQRRQCGANIEASREGAATPTTSLGSLGLSLDDDDDEGVDSPLSGSLWSRILDTPSPTIRLISNNEEAVSQQLPSSRREGGAVAVVDSLFRYKKEEKRKKETKTKKSNYYISPRHVPNTTTKAVTMSELFHYFTENDDDDYDYDVVEVDERQNDKTLLDYMYMNVDWCINFISCSSATATAAATTTTTNHVNELPILGLPIVGYFKNDNYIISTRRDTDNIAPRSRRREGDDSFDTNDDEHEQQQQQYYIAQVLSSTQSDEISSDKQSYESGLSTWGSLLDLDTPLATTDIEEEEEEEEHNNNSGSSNRSNNSTTNVESFTTKHVNVASTQQQQCQSVDNIKQPENELSSSLSTSLRLLPMEELESTETIAVERTSEGRSNDNDSISINSSLIDNIGIIGIAPMSCFHNDNLDNTDVGFMMYNNNLDQECNTRMILSRKLCESFVIHSNNIIGIKEMTKPSTTTTTTTPIHTQLRQMVHARMKTKKNHHTTKQSSATASIIHQSTIVRRNEKSTHHGSCLLPLHNNTTTVTTTTPTVNNNTNNISPLTMAQSNKGDLQRAIRRHKRRNCRQQQQQRQ